MASPPQPPGSALGLLDRLLSYVDRPWKLAAIIIMAVTGLLLWVVWEQRAGIAEALFKTVHPHLLTGAFPKVARELTISTGANIVALLSVEIEANTGRYIAGVNTGDADWQPPGDVRPVFTAENSEVVLAIIQGKVFCFGTAADDSLPIRRQIASWGGKRACQVAVPAITDVIVGGLLLVWRTPLSEPAEMAARQEMRRAAFKLATW